MLLIVPVVRITIWKEQWLVGYWNTIIIIRFSLWQNFVENKSITCDLPGSFTPMGIFFRAGSIQVNNQWITKRRNPLAPPTFRRRYIKRGLHCMKHMFRRDSIVRKCTVLLCGFYHLQHKGFNFNHDCYGFTCFKNGSWRQVSIFYDLHLFFFPSVYLRISEVSLPNDLQ